MLAALALPLLVITVIAVMALGYRYWGGLVAREYRLDGATRTPAEDLRDDLDFVPTSKFYLLGQHFSAIAAAGPIVGPIVACRTFGWLPCILWITFGSVLIGAVHDFSTLVASVRHRAMSIAEIMRQELGRNAWLALMAFIWLALNYVIIAFVDVTASTFVGKTEDLAGVDFNAGGAVAAAAVMYLGLAILLGLVERFMRPPLWLSTIIFVPATLLVVWLGTLMSTTLVMPQQTWSLLILGYCFIASLLPVWLLLQPRGYLGGFILYLAIGVGIVGIFFGGHPIQQPAFVAWSGPKLTDQLFPFLFVTIACGACSGFHGLVCSGTTSKQIAREPDCKPIGYGAMLLEGFVAIIALATVMILAPSAAGGSPGRIYGDGIGLFMSTFLGKASLTFAMTFGAMAFSTFVFDTLDVATRLGRYILQELFGARGALSGALATALTLLMPVILAVSTPPTVGAKPAYMRYWTLFGTSNQLLAGLTLLGLSVWLKRSGRRTWFTLAPMAFIMAITMWSLALQIQSAFAQPIGLNGDTVNGVVSVLLAALAGALMYEASAAFRGRERAID